MLIYYPETEQFRNVVRNVKHKAQFIKLDDDGNPVLNCNAKLPVLKYEGTVKIHGTNASVKICNNELICQSRNNVLTLQKDNYAFAKFILNLPLEIKQKLIETFGNDTVVFGEWAGKDIQSNVAISNIDRFWTIFAYKTNDDNWNYLKDIDLTIFNQYRIFSIRQFGIYNIDIDFEKLNDVTNNVVNKMNDICEQIENECPVGKFFGINGVGEGIVFNSLDPIYSGTFFRFKIKGAKHSKSHIKKFATIDVDKLKTINEIVEKFVTEERLQQGWQYLIEQHNELTEKSTGIFISWICKDVHKEEQDTIDASNISEKEINNAIIKQSRNWFLNKVTQEVFN